MTMIPSSLFSVLKRFPNRKEVIQTRFSKSETFKNICEDYQSCLETLNHWCGQNGEIAHQRRQEYMDLIQELEQEILQSLDHPAIKLF